MNAELCKFTNKLLFANLTKQDPDADLDTKHKYIFFMPKTENSNGLAEALLICGYYAISFSARDSADLFSVESFMKDADSGEFPHLNDYKYILCLNKWQNTRLQAYFRKHETEYLYGWQLFKDRQYLANADYRQELESRIADFIKKYEGSSTAPSDPDDVREKLEYENVYSANGEVKGRKLMQTVRNVETVLECDNRFSGKIRFNEFAGQTYLYGNAPWDDGECNFRQWKNRDDSQAFAIVQSDYRLTNRNDFFDAVSNVSQKHHFHPVRDALESLPYKGDGYIRKLLPSFLGCEDSEYNFQTMRLFMLGAVARVFQPGAKFDYCPILTGRQGIGKSTFLQLLAIDSEWFNDSLDSLDSDKTVQMLQGSWICELAELKSLARTAGGVDSVKRFLSAQADKFRAPYARRSEVIPRQTVFCGTTNKTDFLQDASGNRRFLIIRTGINKPTKDLFTEEAAEFIKSAWAEALRIWQTEQPKLVLPESCLEEAQALQEASMQDDGKTGLITEYLETKYRVCALELWQEALGEPGRPAKWQATEINDIIARIPGWQRMKNPAKFEGYGSQRGFEKIGKDYNQLQCSTDFRPISETGSEKTPFDD